MCLKLEKKTITLVGPFLMTLSVIAGGQIKRSPKIHQGCPSFYLNREYSIYLPQLETFPLVKTGTEVPAEVELVCQPRITVLDESYSHVDQMMLDREFLWKLEKIVRDLQKFLNAVEPIKIKTGQPDGQIVEAGAMLEVAA